MSDVGYTEVQGQYHSYAITLDGRDDEALAKSLSAARVDLNPHQVDASLFALKSPLSKGVLLADEVGLGKTIEAGLVIAQYWAEKKRRILLIVPASLRKQWEQELREKFSIGSIILETKTYREIEKSGNQRPFERMSNVVICSYEFAARRADELKLAGWDLVVFDEAHRLRNVYKKNGPKRAIALRNALRDNFKVLLTATPLQNSLLELFGLVSVIDENYFGGEAAFRTLYTSSSTSALEGLRHRLAPVCKRTLRKQVQEAGHINYTKRHAHTFDFTPGSAEQELYEKVSAFLQREDTISYGDRTNALVILQVRKILGSSTFAIGRYLETLISRLEDRKRASIEMSDDIETMDELIEEADDEETTETKDALIDPVKLQAEIDEIRSYLNLANSIDKNAKGEQLIARLPSVLDEIEARGGQRKAVIFTESVRTQTYLAKLLQENGYKGQIVLLNGSNNDPESKATFNAWKAKHEGTEKISGSRSADMKAAVVEAFKSPEKSILIATESGAEGINLQFCSLLINFDLPWNPQRVEQRIGRCHRYGQKIDVTVVNMLNRKNLAEARIYELLDEKFKLFDGVFGSSDEVLGSIERGIDFQKKVLEIVQKSRSAAAIEAEFDILTSELEDSIKADVQEARAKVLENLDQDVVAKLKSRGDELRTALNDFQRRLLLVARAELPEAVFHRENGTEFDYNGKTYTTAWPTADEKDWHFFRLSDGNLAMEVVEQALSRQSNGLVSLAFNPEHYPFDGQLGDVNALKNQSGWMRVAKVSLETPKADREELLLACVTDDGAVIHPDTADRMLMTPGKLISIEAAGLPEAEIARVMDAQLGEFSEEAKRQNLAWLDEEEERLGNYAKDVEIEIDAQIKEREGEVRELKKERRSPEIAMEEKIKLGKRIKAIEDEIDQLKLTKFEKRKEARDQVEDQLDRVAELLDRSPKVTEIFTLRWSVA